MKETKRSESSRAVFDPSQLEERVRQRAYELYEARSREDGHELDDWLKAEAEIVGTHRKATAA